MTEGFNAADNSSIVPVILPLTLDNCQNSVVGEAQGGKRAIPCGIAALHANLQLSATVKSNPKKTPAAAQKTVGLNCWVRGATFGKWV
jgi:hypothetical protein